MASRWRGSSSSAIGPLAAFVLLAGAYAACLRAIVGRWSFPHDDAFIALTFARNVAERGEWSFRAHELANGATSPMFVWLLVVLHAVLKSWIAAAYAVGGLCGLAGVWVAHRALRAITLGERLATAATLLFVVIHPTVVQAGLGMESSLYGLFVWLGLWAYARERRLLASCVCAVGVFARPELGLLIVLAAVERLWASRREQGRAVEAAGHLLIAALAAGAYAGWNFLVGGSVLPQTFTAKALLGYGGAMRGWMTGALGHLAQHHLAQAFGAALLWPPLELVVCALGLAVVCAPLLGSVILSRARVLDMTESAAVRWAALVLVGWPIVRALIDPSPIFFFQTARYFVPLVPCALVIASVGWRHGHTIPRVAFLSAGVISLVLGAQTVLTAVHLDRVQGEMARWLSSHAGPAELIATHEIGAIGFQNRDQVVDVLGLVEPKLDASLRSGGTTGEYLTALRPSWLVVCPSWRFNQKLLETLPARATRVYETHFQQEALSSNGRLGPLVAYRLEWQAP